MHNTLVAHEQFIANVFTSANSAKLCTCFSASSLEHALDVFEDTRTEEEVNTYLDMLYNNAITTQHYGWSDSMNGYYLR